MALQDLADMRDAVRTWANRRDIEDGQIDDFINIANARAGRLTRLPVFQTASSITFDANGDAALPADYQEATDLLIVYDNKNISLERKPLSYVQALRSGAASKSEPAFFARKEAKLSIAPLPASSISSATLYYQFVPSALTNDTDTNWFITDAPEAILYGALRELALYMNNNEALVKWESSFQNALVEIQDMADRAEESGGTLSVNSTY